MQLLRDWCYALIKSVYHYVGHGYTYLCIPVGMSANGMNSGLCMPKSVLKGTTKNYDRGVF